MMEIRPGKASILKVESGFVIRSEVELCDLILIAC